MNKNKQTLKPEKQLDQATFQVKVFIDSLEELDKNFNEKFEEHIKKLCEQRESFFLTTQTIRNDVLRTLETCKKAFEEETADDHKDIQNRLTSLITDIDTYKDVLPSILAETQLKQLNLPPKGPKPKIRVKSVNAKSDKLLNQFSSKISLKSKKRMQRVKSNAFSFATKFPAGVDRQNDNILNRRIQRQSCFERINSLKKGIENDYEEYLRHKQPRKTIDFQF